MTNPKTLKTRSRPRPDFQRLPTEPIPKTWSDAQAIAVYDFCSVLQELVWRRYEHVLVAAALHAQLQLSSPAPDDRTYPLPFDHEDLPF